jgi:hypothetical protein
MKTDITPFWVKGYATSGNGSRAPLVMIGRKPIGRDEKRPAAGDRN